MLQAGNTSLSVSLLAHCGLKEGDMTRGKCAALALFIGLATTGTATAQAPIGAEARLKEKSIVLPAPTRLSPSGNRTGAVQIGNILYLAGHPSPFPIKGKVGKELTIEQGQQAARQSGLLILATVRDALGSLDRVKRVAKVIGFVNAVEGFTQTPLVVDGFSNLMIEIFGQAGIHVRSAVGVQSLPGDASVEVEAIMEVQ
ncbi:MAG TPA: RidA family protein [Xanthobacteraceae bacterium]|nr:RidA family protein [Xanthobacteraceae bacterium]